MKDEKKSADKLAESSGRKPVPGAAPEKSRWVPILPDNKSGCTPEQHNRFPKGRF